MAPHISKGRHLHLPFTIYHLPFLRGPLPPPRGPPPPRQAVGGKIKEKRPLRHYAYLPTPVWGWVASGARRKGAAYAGSYKNGATYFQRAPLTYLPFTIYNSQFSRATSYLQTNATTMSPTNPRAPFLSLLRLLCFFCSSLTYSSKDFLTVSKAFFLSSD